MGEGAALVPLGLVGAPHGLRGELRVRLYNPASSLLQDARPEVLLRRGAEPPQRRRVRAARSSGGGFVLLELEGVEDRDAADALRGAELCVGRDALPPLSPGEVYLCDLIGLPAVRPDGTQVGTVRAAIEYPASQVLVVALEGATIEVPLVPPYFLRAELDPGRVVVDALDELDRLPEG